MTTLTKSEQLFKKNSCPEQENGVQSLKSISERQILLSSRSLGNFCLGWVTGSVCWPPPHAGECYCYCPTAVRYLLGVIVVGLSWYGPLQWHWSQLKKFLLFFLLNVIPFLSTPPPHSWITLRSGNSCVASLYTTLGQQSELGTQSLPSFSFRRELLERDFHILRSKTGIWYGAWGNFCSKVGGIRTAWSIAHPVQPPPVPWGKCRSLSLQGLHCTVAQRLFHPVLLDRSSEGTMCTSSSRQWPGIPCTDGPVAWGGMVCAPSAERERSLKSCKQSVPVMSSQLIDYWKYNWILCLGEI